MSACPETDRWKRSLRLCTSHKCSVLEEEIGEAEDRLHGTEIELDLVAVSLMHYRKAMMKVIAQRVVRKIYWLVTGSLREEPEKTGFFMVDSAGKRRHVHIIHHSSSAVERK